MTELLGARRRVEIESTSLYLGDDDVEDDDFGAIRSNGFQAQLVSMKENELFIE